MTQLNQTYKAFPYSSFIPYYINGFQLSNDATTPNSILDVATGTVLDSTETFQLVNSTAIKVSSAFTGIGGLDTGTVAASTVYAVYFVADVVGNNGVGAMISKSLTGPLMPYGYNTFALIGFVVTDSSSYFLAGYWTSGDSGKRSFTYDAFQETAITAGTSTSYANVDLTKFVPNFNNLPVSIYTNFSANAAADTLKLQCGNGTGDQVIITAPVVAGTAHTTTLSTVLAQPVSLTGVLSPVINYKVSSGSDAVAIYVAGFQYSL